MRHMAIRLIFNPEDDSQIAQGLAALRLGCKRGLIPLSDFDQLYDLAYRRLPVRRYLRVMDEFFLMTEAP